MRQPLPRGLIAAQRFGIAVREVKDHIRRVACGLGGLGETGPRACQPFARAAGFDQQIGDAKGVGDGGADQVGGLVVVMIGDPRLPAFGATAGGGLGHFGLGSVEQHGLRRAVARPVAAAQGAGDCNRRAPPLQRGHQSTRHRPIPRGYRMIRRL